MHPEIEFLDDVRLAIVKDRDGVPVRAILDLPDGAAEFFLVPLGTGPLPMVLPRFEHKVTHQTVPSERAIDREPSVNWMPLASLGFCVVAMISALTLLGVVAARI